MKLTTSLQKSAVFPLALAILVTLSLFVRSKYAGDAREKQNVAEEILISVLDLNSTTTAILDGGDKANVKLWGAKYNSLDRFLNECEAKGLQESHAIITLRNNLEEIRTSLQKILNLRSSNLSKEEVQPVTNELLNSIEAMKSTATVLARSSREFAEDVEGLANKILLVFMAIFSLLMAGATIAYSQSTMRRLNDLKNAAAMAADGDYKNHVTAGVNDEVGQIIRSFNTMLSKFDTLFSKVAVELDDVKKTSATQKRAAGAARDSNMQLADALTRIKRAQSQVVQQERLRALEQVASGVAKDFNDALTPILSMSDFLLSYKDHLHDEKEVEENLKVINSAAKLARTQVRRLSNIFVTPEKSEPESVDLNAVVEKAVETLEPRWSSSDKEGERQIKCKTSLGELPAVKAIKSDVSDAVIALMLNAIEAMPDGGTLRVSTYMQGDSVVLEVKDSGKGMNEELQEKALEPFFSTKGKDHSGMGLAAVLSAAGQFGGTTKLTSEEGVGTTALMQMKIFGDNKNDDEKKKRKVSKLEILVVDDEEWVLGIVEKCLLVEGHTVKTATTGSDGIELFKNGNYDLVILDWALPDMNGGKIAKIMREIDSHIPVILLSGFGDTLLEKEGVADYISLVLSKPVTMEELHSGIVKAMSSW